MNLNRLSLSKLALIPLLATVLSLPAYAELSVSGNTISWPADGNWYVVQNTQTLEVVCEGGTSCVVSDGEYYVNRHFPGGGGSGVGRVQVGVVTEYSQNQFDHSINVSGNVLSFSLPGWYQVQALHTNEEICAGTNTCIVPRDGDYVVINHSLRLRSVVSVNRGAPTTPTMPTVGSVNVSGNTIRWPDNGWYQVQRTSDFSTVCEGGRSCAVESGVYNVINLSTNERFENISVGDTGTVEPVASAVQVTGQTISWPNNGWYQVQRVDDLATVCQGGTGCDVSPGTYIVINHSTGERFENITVGSHAPTSDTPVINSSNYQQLITQAFEVFSGQAYDDRLVQFPYLVIGPRNELSLTSQSCGNGGILDQSYTPNRSGTEFWDLTVVNCEYGFGGLSNGDIANGVFSNIQNPIGHALRFNGFSSVLNIGGEMQVDGLYLSWLGSNGLTIRSENMDYDFNYSGGSLSLRDVTTIIFRPFSLGCGSCVESSTLEGSFTMEGSSTGGNVLSVNVPTAFEYTAEDVLQQGFASARFTEEAVMNTLRFGTGVLEIVSDSDSSSVTLDANTGNINTVSVVLVNSIGVERFTIDWSEWIDDLEGNRTPNILTNSGRVPR